MKTTLIRSIKAAPPKLPPAPAHFSAEMKAFWARVNGDFELESHQLLTLRLACEAYDRSQSARETLVAEGNFTHDHKGNLRQHPAISIEQNSRIAFLRAMRELALDVTEPLPIGRPPGLGHRPPQR